MTYSDVEDWSRNFGEMVFAYCRIFHVVSHQEPPCRRVYGCAGVPTIHEEQLELGGDLRGPAGHSLAVNDALVVLSGLLKEEPLGGVIGHQSGVVGSELLWRNLSVQ